MHERVWAASGVSFLTFRDLSTSLSEKGVLFLISFFIKYEIKEKRPRMDLNHRHVGQQPTATATVLLNLSPLFP